MVNEEQIEVLHVDDAVELADLTADFLESEYNRFTVETAASASEGLDLIAITDYDCIISAYDMPGQNGIEFLETVREDYSDLPFILYTDKGSEGVASDAIAAGATDYLQKESGSDHYELLANRIQNAAEQSRAQQEVAETEQRLQTIAEHANDVLWNFTADWSEVLFISSAYEDVWGGSVDELRNNPKSFLNKIHPDDRPAAEDAMDRLSAGESVSLEYRVNADEGSERWVWVEGGPVYDSAGEVGQVVGSARDITEHKQREQALAALHDAVRDIMAKSDTQTVVDRAVETTRTVLDQPINGVWLYDPDADVLDPVSMTDDAAELFDEQPTYQRGESLTWQAFTDDDFLVYDDVRTEQGRLNTDTPIRSEIIISLGGHGAMNMGSTELANFTDTDIWLARIFGRTVEAALSRAKREQQLRSQRVELQHQNDRLEQFTNVVSHDLRNPLSVAKGRLELARRGRDSEYLADVAQAHERMQALIDDLLTLARQGDKVQETKPVMLAVIVDDCWKSVQTADATLVCDTTQRLQADSSRLQQLLENIIGNAVEHGGEDVTITVNTLDERAGFYVADDGPGIPEDEREVVFEAGYSTGDKGTGFGLNIVKEIVEAHGWNISVTESEAGGTRFEITGIDEDNG